MAGFHQIKIENAISQQTPDATTSGTSCWYSCAKAASTAAAKIQSCAILIITNKASRACQTAVRPLDCGPLAKLPLAVLIDSAFIATHLSASSKYTAVMYLERNLIERTRWRTIQNFTRLGVKTPFVAGAFETLVLL